MTFKFILLVLPTFGWANIAVELFGYFKGEESNMDINFNGKEVAIISDTEQNTFNLNDNDLKNAIKTFVGQRPDNAYLHSPTPWGDLYKTYKWEQVTRTFYPQRGRILNTSMNTDVLLPQFYENKDSKAANISISVYRYFETTLSTSWRKDGELSIKQSIDYQLKFKIVDVMKDIHVTYDSTWGKNFKQIYSNIAGSTSPMVMVLQPGQSVIVQQFVTRGSIQMDIEYIAYLSGVTAINYAYPYKGHHFYSYPIGACMANGGFNNEKLSHEVIEYSFYAYSTVIVLDKKYGTKIVEVTL